MKYLIQKTRDTLLIIFTCFFIPITGITQIDWPFPNQARGVITGSMGECRGGCRRFHRGTDMVADSTITTISNGQITAVTTTSPLSSFIRMGNVQYYHIRPENGIQIGTNLNLHDTIGYMMTGTNWPTHLHLQNNNLNYLNQQIQPFTDNVTPRFWNWSNNLWSQVNNNTGEEILFFINGLTRTNTTQQLNLQVPINGVNHKVIYNRVDIAAGLRDGRVDINGNDPRSILTNGTNGPNTNHNAPFEISFEILNNNNVVQPETTWLLFDRVFTDNNQTNQVFVTMTPNHRGNNYNITSAPNNNNQLVDRYLNTKLKLNQTENWQSDDNLYARTSDESILSDGFYNIRVRAKDIQFNGTQNINAVNAPVIIDNFLPYVQKVELRLGDIIFLTQEWNLNDMTNNLEYSEDFATQTGPIDILDETVVITIEGSEALRDLALSINVGNTTIASTPTTITEDRIFEFEVNIQSLFELTEEICLEITGQDFAGNELLEFQNMTGFNASSPTNSSIALPIRDQNGNWMPTPQLGTNQVHCFDFILCSNGGGRNNETTQIIFPNNCLEVTSDITHASDEYATDGRITLEVEGGLVPYTFTWENGATTASITDLPAGDYCLTVTDDSCCEENLCLTVKGGCFSVKVVQKGD